MSLDKLHDIAKEGLTDSLKQIGFDMLRQSDEDIVSASFKACACGRPMAGNADRG
jgi:hypothetical protein